MAAELKFYEVRPALSAGVMGESYVATAYRVADTLRDRAQAEYAILITRPAPLLIHGEINVPFGKLPGDLGEYGPSEIHEEAATQAKHALNDFLTRRAIDLGRPELAEIWIELKELERRPFVSAFLQGKWEREIRQLAKESVTEALSAHCKQIAQSLRPLVVTKSQPAI